MGEAGAALHYPGSPGDIAAFVSARLDEVEANARDSLALWPDTHFTIDPGSLVIVEFHRRHDPARVLRDVEAKRAIVRSQCSPYPAGHAPATAVPRHLAAVWNDHPDYRQDWAPMNSDVVVQVCAFCDSIHRENLSVPGAHGEYLYFCTDTCLREWGGAG